MKGQFYVEVVGVYDVSGNNCRVYFDRLSVCKKVQDMLVDLGFTVRFGKEFV